MNSRAARMAPQTAPTTTGSSRSQTAGRRGPGLGCAPGHRLRFLGHRLRFLGHRLRNPPRWVPMTSPRVLTSQHSTGPLVVTTSTRKPGTDRLPV